MEITRRRFGGWLSSAGLAIIMGVSSMALSCANVFKDILNYVPVALQAVGAVMAVLSGGGIAITPLITTALNLVKAAFADLQADVTAYENAPAADKATLGEKVSTALTIVEANVQKFWNDLNLPTGTLASVVAGILGVVLSTLAAFIGQLPAPVPTPAMNEAVAMRKSLTKIIPAAPMRRSAKQMKADINKILTQAGMSQYCLY